MMSGRESKESRGVVDILTDAFDEAACENSDSIQKSLIDEGFDPDADVQEGLTLVKKLMKKQKLVQYKVKLDKLKLALKSIEKPIGGKINEVREAIAKTIAGEESGELVQAYFRKLEKIDEDDLQSISDDAELLELWEKIENE